MKKVISAVLALALSASALSYSVPKNVKAENPIVQTSFTPDPAPVVFGDELYIFTGCDREGNNDFYYMTGWQCFSTKDMKNWTDHGRILEDTSFSWCNKNDAWASQCIERNGKYYFYFTSTDPGGRGREIGVAVADSPEGPYRDVLKKPLCGPNWDYIDPTVMIDDDGQGWLMFGNPTCYYVKLKEDMVTLDGSVQHFDMNSQAFGPPAGDHKTSYGEGPWICKHGDLYYLIYAAFINGFGGESMAYSTAPSITGPWTYRGVIQEGSNCFTTHGGIIDYKDHSYFFYHKNGLKGGGSFNRSAACEEFTFNADGTIPVQKLTNNGPSQIEALNPFDKVEAETICFCSGVKTEKCSNGGVDICNIQNNSYVKISGVDFGEGADKFTACVSSAGDGGTIELHTDSTTGPVIGSCKVNGTGGWQEWKEVSCDVNVSGEHDLYLVFKGGSGYLMNVDWWQFQGAGSASHIDDGYIFRSKFDSGTDGWSGRGGATVTASSDEHYEGKGSVYVSERTSSWQGVNKALNYKFKAGETYSFSANVKYNSGDNETKFHFTLQYDNGSGEPQYTKIDTKIANRGEWIQLANTEFTLPANGKNFNIYVETEGDDPQVNFYVDEIYAAKGGTEIPGAGGGSDTKSSIGDVNSDGKINVFDVILARRYYIGKLNGTPIPNSVAKSVDTDSDGVFTIADIVQISNYVLGRPTGFSNL